MESFTSCAWVLAHKALIVNDFMSGAPLYEIKGEPQSGAGCNAAAFINVRAELLQFFYQIRVNVFATFTLYFGISILFLNLLEYKDCCTVRRQIQRDTVIFIIARLFYCCKLFRHFGSKTAKAFFITV